MDFLLQRLWADKEQTFGFIREVNGLYKAHSLEDEPRLDKIKGETRIPAGRYKLGIRKEDTPLTLKHQISYDRFKSLLQVSKETNKPLLSTLRAFENKKGKYTSLYLSLNTWLKNDFKK